MIFRNEFKIEMSYDEEHHDVKTKVYIDDSEVDCYTDIYALFGQYGKSVCRLPETYQPYSFKLGIDLHTTPAKTGSEFYPFTCSCGNSGCASIWDGIFQKVRKFTVEWRIPDKERNGYNFLGDSYYSFERREFDKEIEKAWDWMWKNKDLTFDYYGDPATIEEELLNFLNYTGSLLTPPKD